MIVLLASSHGYVLHSIDLATPSYSSFFKQAGFQIITLNPSRVSGSIPSSTPAYLLHLKIVASPQAVQYREFAGSVS